jgi:hypothetical protein
MKKANIYNKGFLFSFYRMIGPSLLYLIFPLPIPKKYGNFHCNKGKIENDPIFCKAPLPNAFDVYRFHVKNSNIEQLKFYEESIMSTDPLFFTETSLNYYKGKNIK